MPIDELQIRDATEADAASILSIYNDAVLHTTAIWNDRPSDLEARMAWLAERRQSGYPVLVASDRSRLLGYASFGAFRPWDGYRHTVEHSVYVDRAARRLGVGYALVSELVSRARTMNKHVMVAGIEATNEPSLQLHARLGFSTAGQLRSVGRKFDKWLDLVFMQLTLEDELQG
ncbi:MULTISPECIES: GNAT family N-acetyltransferase [unclassified Bradyrhizobium]|uniref:GNAT family N-acetyltransferase n=1 Tax=unclassified Bradyrhizobium TaxID=2631580 RepID=UPI0028EBE8FE|nr:MULTISPECIES: GNAT family N-acetyltransferase [unclassified Bradyrhizobium]